MGLQSASGRSENVDHGAGAITLPTGAGDDIAVDVQAHAGDAPLAGRKGMQEDVSLNPGLQLHQADYEKIPS